MLRTFNNGVMDWLVTTVDVAPAPSIFTDAAVEVPLKYGDVADGTAQKQGKNGEMAARQDQSNDCTVNEVDVVAAPSTLRDAPAGDHQKEGDLQKKSKRQKKGKQQKKDDLQQKGKQQKKGPKAGKNRSIATPQDQLNPCLLRTFNNNVMDWLVSTVDVAPASSIFSDAPVAI